MPQLVLDPGRTLSPLPEKIRLPDDLAADWQSHGALGEAAISAWRKANHGSLPGWLDALDSMPALTAEATSFADTVTLTGAITDLERQRLRAGLERLIPWRKGPFALFGVFVDSEWRSNRKWRRLVDAIDFRGKRVLDIGCGNGYYGWRMLGAGAKSVVGVDPTLLFVVQHLAVARYLPAHRAANVVLPLAGETVIVDEPYDVVSSMGVIYHRRDPQAHVADLARCVEAGGVLILETLVAPETIYPEKRYANMRNIGCIPSLTDVEGWLADDFVDVTLVDSTVTTTDEQRPTPWMPFHSLENALDPSDPTRTVEGYPAPERAVIIARRR